MLVPEERGSRADNPFLVLIVSRQTLAAAWKRLGLVVWILVSLLTISASVITLITWPGFAR